MLASNSWIFLQVMVYIPSLVEPCGDKIVLALCKCQLNMFNIALYNCKV